MADRADADPLTDAADEDEDTEDAAEPSELERDRAEELASDEKIKKALLKLYARVERGFNNQAERADETLDYWDLYNCKLGAKQAYSGNSQIFVPIIANAVNARKTRFTNQVFPQSGRYVEVTTSDDKPNGTMAMLEHYVRRAKLRTMVMPALVKNGDIEGQYNVYVSWTTTERHVVWKVPAPVEMEGEEGVAALEDEPDMKEETIKSGRPHVEVLSDADVLIEPATADSVQDALQNGGSVTVLRRWSEAKVKQMLIDGEIDKAGGRALLKNFGVAQEAAGLENTAKKMADAAGIKTTGGSKSALIYETWTVLKIDGERRLCRAYFGGEDLIVGARRNPNWNDKCPVISVPIEKVQGAAKGISKLKPCADMQVGANDSINEGMDSAAYALMPIIMTDPAKNPRTGSMILNLAAIWETNPNDTKFAQFPELWKQAFDIVSGYKSEIFQTLSVTPAMMPQSSSGKKKMNQAEIASEQQVDILTTSDAVTVLEEGILTPILNWFCELDHQHRDKDLTVQQFGEFGVKLGMEDIPPTQMNRRYEFRWFGVEQARNAAQVQQQISAMNVLRGIPPDQIPGYQINVVPIVRQLVENTFGVRLAPTIFEDLKAKLSMPPELENQYLATGLDLHVHALDDDAAHMKAHQQLAQQPDPTGAVRAHLLRHVMQMQSKQGQQAQQQQGAPGMPGGGPPGAPGTPRPGAQAMPPRGGQQPPGAMHADRMPNQAPRR